MLLDKTQTVLAEKSGHPLTSVIVPVHNRLSEFEECLESLQPWRARQCELIVVDDDSTGDVRMIAERHHARYFRTRRHAGPAGARNLGARHARGEILVFVDSDVLVPVDALRIIRAEFEQRPHLAALFGSYDDDPRCADFFSSFKNLLHHYVHQASKSEAVTFWSGCGAIRKSAFETAGGFDAVRYPMASIEDIDLGFRLIQQGREVRLIKGLCVKHLKKWTLASLLRTDIFQRAIPWTQLILRTGYIPRDLNLGWVSRASAALVAAMVFLGIGSAAILLGFVTWPVRALAMAAILAALALLLLNFNLYRLFFRKRGARFAVGAIGTHWTYFLYSGAVFLLCCVVELLHLPSRSHRTMRPRTPSPDLD